MAYEIRPLSFGEILDMGFRLFRENFRLIGGLAAVLAVPLFMLSLAQGHPLWLIVGLLAALVISPVVYVALTGAIADVYLDREVAIEQALRSVGPILTPIIGTSLLFFLLLGLAFAALIVPGLYFAVSWSLINPVMIIERRFGMAALQRSRDLVRGVWWRTFGIFFVVALITNLPATIFGLLWGFIPIVGLLLSALTKAIASAYGIIVLVVYYFDRRCRVEDFDLTRLAEQIRAQDSRVSA